MNFGTYESYVSTLPYLSTLREGTAFVWDWLFDVAPCSTGFFPLLFMEHGINYIYVFFYIYAAYAQSICLASS